MAYLQGEAGAVEADRILDEAEDGRAWVLTSAVSLGEVLYQGARKHSLIAARDGILRAAGLSDVVVLPSMVTVMLAAHLKADKRGASYADCFCAALAIELDATVVTGDPEFKLFEPNLEVLWLP